MGTDNAAKLTGETAGINALVEWQNNLQHDIDGPIALTKDNTAQFFLAMIVEAGELVNTLNWKRWKNMHPIDYQKTAGEWGDLLAFFLMNTDLVCQALGCLPSDLVTHYLMRTTDKNRARFTGKISEYGGSLSQRGMIQDVHVREVPTDGNASGGTG